MSYAVLRAARAGDCETLAKLLALSPEWVNEVVCKSTALHFAAENGHDNIVAQLLAAGFRQLDAQSGKGHTALHLAASNGHPKVVAQLLAAGSSLSIVDMQRRTPLHLAALRGHDNSRSFFLSVN